MGANSHQIWCYAVPHGTVWCHMLWMIPA